MEHARGIDAASASISIERCRALLGDEANGLSDEEVDLVRLRADALAHVIVQIFLENGATPP